MSDRYPQVMRLVAETAWAILPSKLAAIQEMLAIRASGQHLTPEEIQARIGSGPAQKQSSTSGSVAVIPIYGTIIPKANMFSDISGGTSIQGLSESLRGAVADSSIGAILFDIDSPGGSTDLVPEFAAEIRNARGSKPIVAIANTDAASAAYWIGSQADEFVVTPSGLVGSIGVFAAHQDVSAAMESEGVKTTLISAGKYKVETSPFEPLSDEARAALQGRVDSFYAMFTRDVAKGRGTTVEAVRGGFGEGRVVTASDALRGGMVDRIATFEATVEDLIVRAASGGRGRLAASGAPPGLRADDSDATGGPKGPLSFAEAAIAVRDAADQLTADAGSLRDLTVAKRDVLFAVAESLTGSAAALAELLANTDPARDQQAVTREFLKFSRSAAA